MLEQITTRKLSALVGGAGTGKTTVLGALKISKLLGKQGILFLAPTGKARVRLGQKTGMPMREAI
jgi:ATP-dependent exoDNAse (exonuclease V) alpha subunit